MTPVALAELLVGHTVKALEKPNARLAVLEAELQRANDRIRDLQDQVVELRAAVAVFVP